MAKDRWRETDKNLDFESRLEIGYAKERKINRKEERDTEIQRDRERSSLK
jgi:hypothetical protein